jgi:hypothetical protein
MTEPTNTDKARYVAERLGLCWHTLVMCSPYLVPCSLCSCGIVFSDIDKHFSLMNPTFTDPAGRIQLLELMAANPPILPDFLEWLRKTQDIAVYFMPSYLYIVHLIALDDTGLLLDAAYQFLKEKGNG